MSETPIFFAGRPFIDRRCGGDRRLYPDPCRNMSIDIYHRKRRKSLERRTPNRSLEQDYLAFAQPCSLLQ